MKFRCLRLTGSIALLACLCMTTTPADALLTSVKSTGMAAAAVAYPQDSLAGAFNPAGMVDVGDRLDVGIIWEQNAGGSRVSGNRAPIPGVNGNFNGHKNCNGVAPDLGVNTTFCDCSMSLGLMAYNRSYSKTRFDRRQPLFGTSNPGMEYIQEVLAPVFAWRVWDGHSIGISLDFYVQTLKVKGLENFDNPVFSSHPGYVTNNGRSWATGVGFTLGWKWDITDCLSFGLAYAPKAHLSRFKDYKGFAAQDGRIDSPERTTVGIAWQFIPCVATVAFDVQYLRWSKVKSLHNPLLNPVGRLNQLGSANGPGFGWKSQTFYRLGVDYRIAECWTIRAGYRFATETVRKSQTAINALVNEVVQNAATIGFTWCMNCNNEFSFFYAHGFKGHVHGQGSIPAFLGGGEADLHQQKNVAGVSWGYLF